MKHKDMSGQTVGYWTLLYRVPNPRYTLYMARCVCGTEKVVNRGNLVAGNYPKSCGCRNVAAKHDLIRNITGQKFG